jgi:hypothetical protein
MNNTEKSEREELTIWGAVGPNGQLVKSSVGTFKSVASRWALRRGNYEVVKLGTIPTPGMEIEKEAKVRKRRASVAAIRREPKQEEVGLSEGGTEYSAPDKLQVDRSFFGRHKRRKK